MKMLWICSVESMSVLCQKRSPRFVSVVEKDGKQEESFKDGKNINLLNLLKSSSKLLKAKCLQEQRNNETDEVEKFLTILNDNDLILFTEAFRATNIHQLDHLNFPKRTPMNPDVQRHRNWYIRIMNDMTQDPYTIITSHEYVTLRDKPVLTLHCSMPDVTRKPVRLTFKEYHNALSNVRMHNEEAELKVTYQPGKGAKHLVPVLLPYTSNRKRSDQPSPWLQWRCKFMRYCTLSKWSEEDLQINVCTLIYMMEPDTSSDVRQWNSSRISL